MASQFERITIAKLKKQPKADLNQQIQWLSISLGLFNPRDKDRSCFRLFIELLKSAKKEAPMTSDELAYKLNLSRGTVVHHLNKLMESGIVIKHNNKYLLKAKNLENLIKELKADANSVFETLIGVANKIDRLLGL